MNIIECHRSVISLKSFFAVLQSRLRNEFWLLMYPVAYRIITCLFLVLPMFREIKKTTDCKTYLMGGWLGVQCLGS